MQIIDIDSIDDERVAAYTNLTELQLRNRLEPQKGLFIAESPKVIDRALAAGREPLSLLVERPWLEGMTAPFAVRVSMGTVFQVPWTRIGGDDTHYWPWQGLKELHDLGFTTAAMALDDDSISLDELVRRLHLPMGAPDAVDRLALIFGTEGDGLSHHTIAQSDLTVRIPMSHGVDSLNVAASSAVAFYSTRVRQN